MAKTVLLVPHNHFDPTWRRCFDRPAVKQGLTVRSYAEVEAHCIDTWLDLAQRGYPFSEGQAAVWRKYIERNPDKLNILRTHARQGLLDVSLAGETVQDSAMSTAEGLVRNFLVAAPFYRDFVGDDHPGLKLAWVEDAFGNSPNYPQVLKGVGANVVCATTYRACPEDVWVGIDGTKILCYDNFPAVRTGGYDKHPPCPTCKGQGCQTCDRTGLMFIDGFEIDTLRADLEKAVAADGEWIGVFLTTEEIRPDVRLLDLVDELNAKYVGQATIKMANPVDLYNAYLPTMQASLATRDETPTEDLNPAMVGCMVSRIRCKQRTRAIAYKLVAAEAILANCAWQAGQPVAQSAAFTQAWRNVAFNQFHDAITGTHIDTAHIELMDMLDAAEAVADAVLPSPADPARDSFSPAESQETVKRMGNLEIRFDKQGILAILCDDRDLFGELPAWPRHRRPLRIAELTLEADFGDAWGTHIEPFASIERDKSMIRLGDYHDRVETTDAAIRWHGRYTGGDHMVATLEWTVTVRPSADGQRLEFETEVDWDTQSRRLRVIVPVASGGDTATYEVPFGFIDRTYDPSKLSYSQWRPNHMEFPTLHWACKKIDATSGVAVFNKGLPCNRWTPGRFDLSLLRSPQWSFCAVESSEYEFWDIDGQRDTGQHRFEYAIYPYANGATPTDLTQIGYAFNQPLPIHLPFAIEGDVVVTAWKPAEDASGWILRLQETAGIGTTVRLGFENPRQVARTDLLEQPLCQPETTTEYAAPLHKHGILTLWIR